MRKRRRKRQVLKWTGTVLSILLLALWIVSHCVTVCPRWLKEDDRLFVGLGNGCCECYYPAGLLTYRSGMMFGRVQGWQSNWLPVAQWIPVTATGTCWYVCVPLWLPFAVVAGPTGLLWWLERRCSRPGHCINCGYNLTGNISGVCPECGEPR